MQEGNHTRKDVVIAALLDAWKRQPHQRLGQLLYNTVAPSAACPELFYIEDKELFKLLENKL